MKLYVILRDGERFHDCPTIEGARLTSEEAEVYCAEQNQREVDDDNAACWHFLEIEMPLAVAHELMTTS